MRAVGLHFGHDASGAVVEAGGLTAFLDKERRSRVKHALGLASEDLRELLADSPPDTALGLGSTQDVPILLHPDVTIEIENARPVSAARFLEATSDSHYPMLTAWDPDFARRRGVAVDEDSFGYKSRFTEDANRSFDHMGMVAGQIEAMTAAMRRTASLTIDGRTFPGFFYQHHFLHACYAGWTASPDRPALVITQDAGDGPRFKGGGVYFWRPDQALLPVVPADGWIGRFYNIVGLLLGFQEPGGAGKLMGLAPYGRPIYFDPLLVGTRWQVTDGYRLTTEEVVFRWLERFGLSRADLPAWDAFTDRPPVLAADIAASAQLILERNIQEFALAALRIAQRARFAFDSVVLAGGVALNCPANSNLAVTLGRPVTAPPALNDEGLSIGAAAAAHFDATGNWPKGPTDYAEAAYIGRDVTEPEVLAAAARHGWRRTGDDGLEAAARLLLATEPVGLLAGRAEAGPRALGHRSILANPAAPQAWAATNRLKRREPWRPFAPAVLLECAAEYFDRGPAASRFMLFNYRCNTKALPAITHYDHSARVQHVSARSGRLFDLLKTLQAMGAPPVVLNTSFNGPGTSIVDTAEDAFAEAATLGLRHILTDYGLFTSAS